MPRALLLLLWLASARAADVFLIADSAAQTQALAAAFNETVALADSDDSRAGGEHEPVVRKKRTFGDIVFRGLADVLGYRIARKPPQAYEFPPPLGPVPGIDAPVQAGPAPPPPAALASAAPPAPPCGSARAAATPPCRARAPPAQPKAVPPPCAKPRAATPRPKSTRPPAPVLAPPCGAPRANPTTQAPCAPAPATSPKADSNLESINTNFSLNFNFNRAPATPVPAAEEVYVAEDDELAQQAPTNPIAIQPRAAKLPPPALRSPRVYVDAFVLRDGLAHRVHAVDAQSIDRVQAADDDYLLYDDEAEPQPEHQYIDDVDYEDAPQPRGRASALRDGSAVDHLWTQRVASNKLPPVNDYRNVHFGDRDIASKILRERDGDIARTRTASTKPKRLPLPIPTSGDVQGDNEITTTTQDPRRKLKPRVLPPTEHHPNQIDTVTVRVPPIYREKHPKKLHRETPEESDDDEDNSGEIPRRYGGDDLDAETEQSSQVEQTEGPKRRRRRKKSRRARSIRGGAYSAGDYDYFGKKIPISQEEEHFRALTIPPPTRDADVARWEGAADEGHFLDDHERLRGDSERIREKPGKGSDEAEMLGEEQRSDGESERADESEKSNRLSPSARVRESGYGSKYVRAREVRVDRAEAPE